MHFPLTNGHTNENDNRQYTERCPSNKPHWNIPTKGQFKITQIMNYGRTDALGTTNCLYLLVKSISREIDTIKVGGANLAKKDGMKTGEYFTTASWRLTDRLTESAWLSLSDWLTDRPTDRPTDWLSDWLTDWPTDWLTESGWLSDWMTDWPTDWLNLTDWLTHWLTVWLAE